MDSQNIRILMIDDDRDYVEILSRSMSLHNPDFSMHSAGSLKEAFKILDGEAISLIVLDLNLSDSQGLDTFHSLSQRDYKIPIIIMSGEDDEELAREAVREGAQDYLVKGEMESGVMTRLMRHAVERHQLSLRQEQTSEQRFRRVIENNADGIVVLDVDSMVLYVNPAAEILFGKKANEILGSNLGLPVIKENRAEIILTRANGEEIIAEMHVMVTTWEGQTAYIASLRDITRRKNMEMDLRESEERYALVCNAANDGLWDWDLKKNQIYFSSRWKHTLGYEENEIQDSPGEWFNRVHPEDMGELKEKIRDHLGGENKHFEFEYRMRHKLGHYIWVLNRGMAVFNAGGEVYRIAGSQSDITEKKRAEEQLQRNAFYDPLTALPNRALFVDRLERLISRGRREPHYLFAVLFLDLDRFKVINDSLGHVSGDSLLVKASQIIQRCLRDADTVARFGGDEFGILLDGLEDFSQVADFAEKIKTAFSPPICLDDHEVMTSASIGIALSASHYARAEDLIRDADNAMYRAKALGKARYVIFDPEMHEKAISRLRMEIDLATALEKREFLVFYQPIVSLKTGKITGLEALVRWQHPERGLIPPNAFIPLAEETGFIVKLGQWVFNQACWQAEQWRQQEGWGDLRLAVNFSARQFQQEDLKESIHQCLQNTGFPPENLQIEITESTVMKNADFTNKVLIELNRLGIKISIDDFGTGYSSLAYLQRFPISILKVDQTFIRDLIHDSNTAKLTRAIIAMAHQLNMKVVAEGVETEEQRVFLEKNNCDEIQGYLISRPMAAENMSKLLTSQSSARAEKHEKGSAA